MRVVLLLSVALTTAPALEAIPYVVLGRDATTTQTMRVLADQPLTSLRYRVGDGVWTTVEVTHQPLPAGGLVVTEGTADRATPGAVVTWDDGTTVLGSWHTLRDRLDPPLRVALGGDMMHQPDLLAATCKAIAKEDPEVAVIGGDWAYDDADPAKADRWPTLLATWRTTMVRSDGTGVPIVPVVGNHELKKRLEGTPFAVLFPEPTTRLVDLGSQVSLVVLNSGHPTPVADQSNFLEQALASRRDRPWRFATYHVPAYPSVRPHDEPVPTAIRQQWVPRFESGGVAAVFENHDHARKRTHPLLGGVPAPGGVVYLGDGAWGVGLRPTAPLAQRPWIAAAGSDHHAWLVTVGPTEALARAIGPRGELDRVILKPR